MDWLAEQGFNPEFGARPLKRVIQKKVLNKISDELLTIDAQAIDKLIVDVKDGKIVMRSERVEDVIEDVEAEGVI